MDQATITDLTRKGLRNSRYNSTDITAMTLEGVLYFGNRIKTVAPTFFKGRQILSSNTHVFDWPSDCQSVVNVFDTRTNATTVTAATNASPIQITAASHGLEDDDIVLTTGIGTNTAANGTFKVTYVDDDNVTLNGSTGNGVGVTGGKIIKWSSTFQKMHKQEPGKQSLLHRWKYYLEGKTIVVDDINYTYDIIVDYDKRPDAITDIPAEYHMGLVGFNVRHLLKIPEKDHPDFSDLLNAFNTYKSIMVETENKIDATFLPTTEPVEIPDVEHWDII